MHYYLEGRNGDFAIKHPLVLGNEAAGTIMSVGVGVWNLYPGQQVAIEAGVMCRRCDFCKSGRYNLCKSMRFASSAKVFPHLDGTLQDRMNHPGYVLHPSVFHYSHHITPPSNSTYTDCLTTAFLSRQHWQSSCLF